MLSPKTIRNSASEARSTVAPRSASITIVVVKLDVAANNAADLGAKGVFHHPRGFVSDLDAGSVGHQSDPKRTGYRADLGSGIVERFEEAFVEGAIACTDERLDPFAAECRAAAEIHRANPFERCEH